MPSNKEKNIARSRGRSFKSILSDRGLGEPPKTFVTRKKKGRPLYETVPIGEILKKLAFTSLRSTAKGAGGQAIPEKVRLQLEAPSLQQQKAARITRITCKQNEAIINNNKKTETKKYKAQKRKKVRW